MVNNKNVISLIGERLKELREEKGLGLKELSDATKISTAALSRWENNLSDIKGSYLIILAKYFNVSTDFLLGLVDY